MFALFIVETKSQDHDSDYVYINTLVKNLYGNKHKYDRVYMNGKSNYNRQEKKINSKIKQFHASNPNAPVSVFMCIDVDEFIEPEKVKANNDLNKNIVKYCNKHGYKLIWFYRNIEDVFWEKEIPDKEKCKMATKFVADNKISVVKHEKLENDGMGSIKGTSNIKKVLDECML